jgi:hypothetical protein
MTRDIERGVRGIESLISYSLYSIVPTLIEVALVLSILAIKFDAWFAWITLAALSLYIFFTVRITEWKRISEFKPTNLILRLTPKPLTHCSTTRRSNTLAMKLTKPVAMTKVWSACEKPD